MHWNGILTEQEWSRGVARALERGYVATVVRPGSCWYFGIVQGLAPKHRWGYRAVERGAR